MSNGVKYSHVWSVAFLLAAVSGVGAREVVQGCSRWEMARQKGEEAWWRRVQARVRVVATHGQSQGGGGAQAE